MENFDNNSRNSSKIPQESLKKIFGASISLN